MFIELQTVAGKIMINSKSNIPHYGGQALIEGVLMRGKKYVVAAMRQPDNEIHLVFDELQGIYKSGLSKIPFLRGLIVLWDSLSLGMKYLTISANTQAGEDEKIEGPALFVTLTISILLSIGIFFVLPTIFVEMISRLLPLNPLTMNMVEGLIRLGIFVLYIWAIGFSKDISRVFAYHGAEHKTINAFEEGVEINVSNVSSFPLAHPRCGTSFLLTLVIFSILLFTLFGPLPLLIKIITRILLVPILAMLAYEIIRFMGDHLDNPIVKVLTSPNLLLQKLTTREPSEEMVEVAISSFNKLLQLENIT